ncbi:ATP-binding response regulator [Scytonema sp. HK-05]|uniref:ATP-binding response regulator n=1 Tax=Scytonema sp. HK-05 TaxID=1137095 RepID=UPI000937601B|nr:hybrid sensor histidine kinase/response regulator [Scytonema sp. HK-05]OKH55427.1 hybrid sensor histidine kinase/response regulator [Scytonema sp. HK-05]
MLKYPLYEFIATVPNCVETTTVAVVLEIFQQQQCDRLAVLDKQKCLLGLIYSARLLPQLLTAVEGEDPSKFLDLQQRLSTLDQSLIEPIQTIPASFNVEQFSSFLRFQKTQANTNLDWALIDLDGKFLGLVDSPRLLGFLREQKLETETSKRTRRTNSRKTLHKSSAKFLSNITEAEKEKNTINKSYAPEQRRECKPLVELLERLPWPLMLQTGNGEVVTQNPAWWQQLGALKDPEGIKRQVEAILANAPPKKLEYATQTPTKVYSFGSNEHFGEENSLSAMNEVMPQKGVSPRSTLGTPRTLQVQEQSLEEPGLNRCFLDSQLGTCTCIVEVQNGQERVWQFAKIPLDSPDLKALSTDFKTLSTQNSALSSDLWLMLATDVTEQQQLCKELAAKNADLIQLNRLKDEFLACISHELKTPLTAVLGLSRLLVDQQLGELNERQARYAGLIHQSGRHLMSVVNDILDLTRMETGQMELTLTNVNIQAVCDRAVSEAKAIHTQSSRASLKSQAESTPAQEHQFSLSIEPGLDQIMADDLRMRQMLVHLLSNAFKFTETGGEIGLRVSRWEGWIAFTVWDTGIGIAEHQQHLIFQKFQQLENPLTRQHEGTGLGLVLTRALARLHGGDVSFLSREGKGSQFTLLLPPSPPKEVGRLGDEEIERNSFSPPHSNPTLPLGKSPEAVRETRSRSRGSDRPPVVYAPSSPHHPTSSKSLVLVVEAVARYIEDLTEQLTGLGYRVVIARSGCEAVEKARRLQPKAIFLNPLLPLLSGWDVLTLLKSDGATRHIPVIVTATGAEKEQAFANRADGFLSLPVQHQVLTPLVESLCAPPEAKQQKSDDGEIHRNNTPLKILRLVNAGCESLTSQPLLQQHRVIEVDDLDQAELLARVWQFDVVLLDTEMPAAEALLKQLSQHPRLADLPLVTCNVSTTQTASRIPKLSVFPCLTPLGADKFHNAEKTEALLSVLQIASGACCPPSILVVDLAILPDLPEARHKHVRSYRTEKNSSLSSHIAGENALCPLTISRGSEWFQALIQYLQTAGLKASMSRSWAELLQQIRHQSVDLLLICLGDPIQKEVYSALKTLGQLPFNLPPVLLLDQRLNPYEVEDEQPDISPKGTDEKLESIEAVVSTIASQILPRSISMEDLLNEVNKALKGD